MAVEPCGDIVTAWVTEDKALWIAKHSPEGAEIWAKTLDDPELSGVYPNALVATPQGEYVLADHRAGNDGDIFYAVLDQDAGLIWSETIDGSANGPDRLVNVAVAGQLFGDELHGWVRMFAP